MQPTSGRVGPALRLGWPVIYAMAAAAGLGAQTIPNTLTISATSQPPYLADQTIATSTTSPFTLSSGASAVFQAGTSITLNPGFHAATGSSFAAIAAAIPSAASVAIAPTTPAGGATAVVTVTLTGPAPPGGAPVALISTNPTVFPNGTCTVPAGLTSTACAVVTGAVSTSAGVTVTATYNGGSPATGVIVGGPPTITWTFNSSAFSIPSSSVEYVGNGSGAYFSWTANINLRTVAPPGAVITSSTINASGLSGSTSWDSQWGAPPQGTCGYYTSGTDNSSQAWVTAYTFWPHGGTAGCVLSVSGQSSLSGTVTFWMPSVSAPNAPSGPASGTISTSYTYSTGGSTAVSGDTPQYMFNWGDGASSGWLPAGTTSASHTWTAAGTYHVTATAQDAPYGVTSGASSVTTVTINPPPPTLTSMTPSAFVQGSSLSVTLTGTNFVPGATAVSTSNSGVAVSVTASTSTSMTATFTIGGSAPAGPATVWVTTAGGTSGTQSFTVYAPVTTTISTFPVGLSISVDGATATPCNPYCTYNWVPGSGHTITASTQAGNTGTQWVWSSWSDGGAATHGITASTSGVSYTANFNPQYYFTATVSPAGAGTVSPASGWYNAGASFSVTANPNAGYQLSSFSPGGALSSYGVVMNGPVTLTANFSPFTGQAIASNPPGAALTVDMTACTAPCMFNWTAGSQHTIGTAPSQTPSAGTQLTFSGWSDNGAISHTITAAPGATFTASFNAQYYLTTAALPANSGSVSPPSGWYNSGQIVQVTATGSSFAGFSGGLSGTNNPQSVTMNGPVMVTAAFASNVITVTPAFHAVVPVGGSSTVMYTYSIPSGQSSGGGHAVVKPRIKHRGDPRDDGSGCFFSDALLNGSCYSNGNSGMSMAITQAIDYVSSAFNGICYVGAFWATFSSQSNAPVPGPFEFTCDCENYGCTLGVEPVNTVPSTPTPEISGVYPPSPWQAGTTIPDLQILGSSLDGSLTVNIAWDDGNYDSYGCLGLGDTSCDVGSITVPADAVGTAVVSVASGIDAESVLDGAPGGEVGSNEVDVEVDAATALRILAYNEQSGTKVDVTGTTPSVIIGHWVDLTATVPNSGSSSYAYQWSSPPGNAVTGWDYGAIPSVDPTTLSSQDLQKAEIAFAWVDNSGSGGELTVTATPVDGGAPLNAKVTYSVQLPSVTLGDAAEQSPIIYTSCPGQTVGTPGMCLFAPPSTNGIVIPLNDYQAPYDIKWFQVLNSSALTSKNSSGASCTSSVSGLDGGQPMPTCAGTPDSVGMCDSPGVPLPLHTGDQQQSAAENFSAFLMFRPDSLSDLDVLVPLGRIDWSWSAQASKASGAWSISNQDPPASGFSIPPAPAAGYPKWTTAANPTTCTEMPGIAALVIATQVTGGTAATITITLNAPAPTGGATIALTSSGAAFSVPASCGIPAGATTSQDCSGAAGAVTSSTPITVTATYSPSTIRTTLTVVPQR